MSTTSNPASMDGPAAGIQTFYLVREARAPKLGLHSTGQILYQVLTDAAREALFLRIAGNEGGGYVSDEAVPLHAIRMCINEHDGDKPLRASVFMPAFIGRSSNNPTFLSALLLQEGLIQRDPVKPHCLLDVGGWQAWATRHLSVEGELQPVKVGKEPLIKKLPAPTAGAPDGGVAAPAVEAGEGSDASGQAQIDSDVAMDGADDAKGDVAGDVADLPSEAAQAEHEATDPGDPALVKIRRKGRLTLRG